MSFLVVPVEVIQYSIVNRKIYQLQLFLYMKIYSSGHFYDFKKRRSAIARDLGICLKTLKSRLQWLEQMQWVLMDKKSDTLIVRGFPRIQKITGNKSKVRSVIYPEWFNCFRAWAVGSVICTMIRWQKRSRRLQGPIRRGSKPRNSSTPYFGLANSVIAETLNLSIKQASVYKHLAAKHGFVSIIKRFDCISENYKDKHAYITGVPEESHRVRIIRGKLMLQLYDEIKPGIVELR